MFSVRIVTADFYLAGPIKDLDVCHSDFRESDVKKVPVVRIFGATPAGLTTLVYFVWLLLTLMVVATRGVLCGCCAAVWTPTRLREHNGVFKHAK